MKKRGEKVEHLALGSMGYTVYTETIRSRFLGSRGEGLYLGDHRASAHSRALNGWSLLIHPGKELAVCGEQVLGQKTRFTWINSS